MTKILVKPAPGRRVRRPDGRVLEEAGAAVERTPYWLRRAAAGDVTIGKAPAAPKPKAKSSDKREG